VRDPTWLAWELILGLGILALPDLQSGVRIPAWWKIGLFDLLGMSVLPNWNAMRVDAESLELLGVAACAALFAAYGAGAAATSALYKTEMHAAVERQVSLS
jgi:fumarate reductase subunit D